MEVVLSVPDDILAKLQEQWGDLPHHALEALAAEAYRAGILTAAEVQRMLGLASRWETDAVLQRAGAYLHYSARDLEQDLATLGRLSPR